MASTHFTAGPDLPARLALDQVGETSFRGECGFGPALRGFGGQLAAHAAVAAGRTVQSHWPLRSLHAYFLSPSAASETVQYEVDVVRDGRTAAVRRVVASQGDRRVFTMTASFQALDQESFTQLQAPSVPRPEELQVGLAAPLEVRPVTWAGRAGEAAPRQQLWYRCPVPLPDDPLLHAAAATFASDLTLGWSPWKALGVHRVIPAMFGASIDHAMWFHREFRADSWLLMDQGSQTVASGRGLALGHVYDLNGNLVITTAQEGVMRGIAEATATSATEPEGDHDNFVIA